jgi:hypothetical protein
LPRCLQIVHFLAATNLWYSGVVYEVEVSKISSKWLLLREECTHQCNTFQKSIVDGCIYFSTFRQLHLSVKNKLLFRNVATDCTVRPCRPHASRGQYVVRVWFSLSVPSVWAFRTEEMTGMVEWLLEIALGEIERGTLNCVLPLVRVDKNWY